jgi:intracellular sulfur oxidation DsrE/DsrF family protein
MKFSLFFKELKMVLRLVLALITVSISGLALAQSPSTGPYVNAGGPAFEVPDRDVPLREGQKYRVVYELTQYPGEKTDVNRSLEVVGRFMNMHGKNGVPLEDLDVAVVIHGQTLLAMLNDETYEEMFGVKNPSLPLIDDLAKAGVQLYVCGQSLGFRGLDKSVLADNVKVGLSAMTMLVTLQSDGYTYLSHR